jgi:hypothetical protein
MCPRGGSFRLFTLTAHDSHFLPYALFLAQVTGVPGVPALPEVSFVDPTGAEKSRARRTAVARPMPWLAPVTRATDFDM